MKKYVIGVDVGGTNVKLGLVNSSGRIIFRSRLVTGSFVRNKSKLINALVLAVGDLIHKNHLTKRNILGIGFGFPGLINPQKGIVHVLPNIPGWRNVPFKNLVQKKLAIPAYLENDVNLITLGEWKFGAGKGVHDLICMTLGTGVGSGLILDNTLYRGKNFVAGELGHMPLNEKGPECSCGGRACFERYVGNRHLLQKARKIFKNKKIQLEDIYTLAGKRNRQALRFWDEMATHIGHGLIGVVNLLNPSLIIIGGGVSNNYRFLHKRIQYIIKKRAMKVQAKAVKITRAQLGDDAGIIGAQVLVKDATLGHRK